VEVLGLIMAMIGALVSTYTVLHFLLGVIFGEEKSQNYEHFERRIEIKKSIDYNLMNTLDQYQSSRNFGNRHTHDYSNHNDHLGK
jgi:hypothetical protein